MKYSEGQVLLSDLFDLADNKYNFNYSLLLFDQEFKDGDKLLLYDDSVLLITDLHAGMTTFLPKSNA